MTNLIVKLLLAISIFTMTYASAENMKKLGSMNVHYMAIGSTFFTPEIAKAYGITRSRYNGLVNISVLDNTKPGNPPKQSALTAKQKIT
ncbi:DUF4426 domain-containing protein [Colwellia sp. MSW7]|uniref:DUF4426 domain-containing protein n=1 Tax=Colwellia maritima TaxID=2912588 RepID=A0ABS9WZG3_9GAMM|nr:DUF4426 domain-containing protein [Colwellia maritima]MCI2283321.1 DUF4426 domain-containing protein [Colwellia maritima]